MTINLKLHNARAGTNHIQITVYKDVFQYGELLILMSCNLTIYAVNIDILCITSAHTTSYIGANYSSVLIDFNFLCLGD